MVHPIKAALLLEQMSQRELARLTGYREETISRVLRGHDRPSEKMMRKLAAAVGMKVADLSPPGRAA